MPYSEVATLCWGHTDYKYKGQGCRVTFDYLRPAASDDAQAIELLSSTHNKVAEALSWSLPKGALIIEARVGYYGAPPDSMDALPGVFEGLHSGATYKFGTPNDMRSCLQWELAPSGGRSSNFWLRLLDDDDVIDNFFQQYPAGYILKPSAPPAPAIYTDSKVDILRKTIETVLFYTVQGRKNPIFGTVGAPGGTLPYQAQPWRRATAGNLTSRKWGKPSDQKAGRRRAFA